MRFYLIAVLILLIFSETGFSQNVMTFSRQDSAMCNIYLQKAQEQDSLKHPKAASDFYNKIAMLYWEHNQFDNAVHYFKISLKQNEKIANENAIAMINSNLALIYSDNKKYDEALKYFNQTLIIRKSKRENIGIISALINMSVVHNKLGQYNESVSKLNEALDIAREMNDPKQMFSCYGMLSETYEKMGDTKKSLEYYELFRTFYNMIQKKKIQKSKEELENERLRAQLAEAEKIKKEYELKVKNAELKEKKEELTESNKQIEDLVQNLSKKEIAIKLIASEAANEKLIAEQKIEKREQIIWGISGLAFFIGLIVIILLIAYRHKQRTNKKLAYQNQQILTQKEEISAQAEHLNEAYERLKELDDLKEQLTAMIVHDIKNPANTIIQYAQKEHVTHAGKEILHLVENILDVQKYENSQIPLNKSTFRLQDALNESFIQIKYLAGEKNINLINNIPQNIYVNADFELITRVFINLLTNAVKFSSQNSKVETGIKKQNNKQITIYVKDEGQGIPPDKINSVFDKFSQVISRKSGLARSTGLGLTFCKMAIEAHQCEIGINSKLNKGSEFWCTLELSENINDIQTINSKIPEKDTPLNLSEKEQNYLQKFIEKYKEHDIYDIVPLRKITAEIDENFSENIKQWKIKMQQTVYNCNEEVYEKILNEHTKNES